MRNREDWLCEQLENEGLNQDLRRKYEAELEDFAIRHERAAIKKKQAEEKEAIRRAEIRLRIEAEDMDFVWTLGEEEFKDDYEIVVEGVEFVLYSKVARDDQTNRRPHETMEKAQFDLRYLYYNRLYTKYVRRGEVDAIIEVA